MVINDYVGNHYHMITPLRCNTAILPGLKKVNLEHLSAAGEGMCVKSSPIAVFDFRTYASWGGWEQKFFRCENALTLINIFLFLEDAMNPEESMWSSGWRVDPKPQFSSTSYIFSFKGEGEGEEDEEKLCFAKRIRSIGPCCIVFYFFLIFFCIIFCYNDQFAVSVCFTLSVLTLNSIEILIYCRSGSPDPAILNGSSDGVLYVLLTHSTLA